MINQLTKLVNSAISFSFFALVVITPILFSTKNTELFEVPKMTFVYLIASILPTLTLFKFALEKKITVPKNPIIIAFLIFLLTQIVSTITSIDKFTSIFGYPSRLNGGLFSQFAYFVIFLAALVNLDAKGVHKIFLASIVTALAVALWGIPAHFGYDPNCAILTGNLDSTCWQKEFDPTKRIFSTLGQPNWLASYFVLIIPASLALVLISKKQILRLIFSIVSIIIFIAFIFTNSRAGFAGLSAAIFIFALLLGQSALRKNLKVIVPIVLIFAATTIFFGITLISRIGEIVKGPDPTKLAGTESTQIRLIVWQGAIEVFKKYPILGAGPETFAYSYYGVRPLAHNQTTEWSFFYNKAHNEFLNYLAGSGIVGLFSYLTLLLVIFVTLFKGKFSILRQAQDSNNNESASVLTKAVLAAFLGYQITIFFGFSIVATQVLFYLFAASVLVLAKENQTTTLNMALRTSYFKTLLSSSRMRGSRFSVKLRMTKKADSGIGSSRLAQTILYASTLIIGIFLISNVLRIYFADLLIARAKSKSFENPNAIALYKTALSIYPASNPFYLSDSAQTMAYSQKSSAYSQKSSAYSQKSSAYSQKSSTYYSSEELAESSASQAQKAATLSPNNLLVLRRVANTYFLLAQTDKKYEGLALETAQKLTQLAPTDPQSYLSLAKIQAGLDRITDAKVSLEKALELKPDYLEATDLIIQIESQPVDPSINSGLP